MWQVIGCASACMRACVRACVRARAHHQDSRTPAALRPLDTPVPEWLDDAAQPLLAPLERLADDTVNGHGRGNAFAHAAPLGDNRTVLAAWDIVGQERHPLRHSIITYLS